MVRITGRVEVGARLSGAAGEKVIREVGQALFAGGQIIEAEAKISITEGAVSGKGHVPSLPGQPPKNDTGTLVSHIETTQTAPLVVEVSSNAAYAVPLEVGTSKMAERPYMGPAAKRKRKEVVDLVGQAVSHATKRNA
jgi:HK97 gp10 family phage protein